MNLVSLAPEDDLSVLCIACTHQSGVLNGVAIFLFYDSVVDHVDDLGLVKGVVNSAGIDPGVVEALQIINDLLLSELRFSPVEVTDDSDFFLVVIHSVFHDLLLLEVSI